MLSSSSLSQETNNVETTRAALKNNWSGLRLNKFIFIVLILNLKEIMSCSPIQKRYQKMKLWKIDSFKE
jgi:hypothetical protein